LLSTWVMRATGPGFPWGTFAVNILGCFALELLVSLVARGFDISPGTRLLLTSGIMGGFTTYSSFNTEALALFRGGSWAIGISYLGATVIGCVLAGTLGAAAGRLLWSASS
jgi:fluoride exporter